ncbi:MAG: glycerophosphodiester phosphodiesterase [Gemmatimonadota bacterium]
MNHAPLVIAHRGASAYAPEHTFAAWDLALAMGADYLEPDLQMTADGVLVVLHDATLERTVRGPAGACTGPVIERTLAELAGCNAGSWFNEAFPDRARPAFAAEPVPTLEAVLARYAGRTRFYVETKHPEEAPGMEEALLALLDRFDLRRRAGRDWSVVIQSFSAASLAKLHAADPTLPLVQLTEHGRADPAAVADYAIGIGPYHADVTGELVAAAQRRCLEVHAYTVDEPARMAELIERGVSGLFTNRPDALVTLLGQRGTARGGAPERAARAWRACRAGS